MDNLSQTVKFVIKHVTFHVVIRMIMIKLIVLLCQEETVLFVHKNVNGKIIAICPLDLILNTKKKLLKFRI